MCRALRGVARADRHAIRTLASYRADGTHLRSFRHRPARGNNSSVGGLALDPDGNVVIAGSSETNDAYGTSASAALVAKFSREGTLAWARYLPDDTRHSERYAWGKDIAVGLDGSLYVAASRYGASMDVVLWKLAPQSGQILWKRTFATEDSDNLLGVAVRPGSGEICAAGVLGVFSATPNPALVACYSPDGVSGSVHPASPDSTLSSVIPSGRIRAAMPGKSVGVASGSVAPDPVQPGTIRASTTAAPIGQTLGIGLTRSMPAG